MGPFCVQRSSPVLSRKKTTIEKATRVRGSKEGCRERWRKRVGSGRCETPAFSIERSLHFWRSPKKWFFPGSSSRLAWGSCWFWVQWDRGKPGLGSPPPEASPSSLPRSLAGMLLALVAGWGSAGTAHFSGDPTPGSSSGGRNSFMPGLQRGP